MALDETCLVEIQRTGLLDDFGESLPDATVYSESHWTEVQDGAAGVNILVGELLRTGNTRRFTIRWFDHSLLPPAVPPEGRVNVYCTHRGLRWFVTGITEVGRRRFLELECERTI